MGRCGGGENGGEKGRGCQEEGLGCWRASAMPFIIWREVCCVLLFCYGRQIMNEGWRPIEIQIEAVLSEQAPTGCFYLYFCMAWGCQSLNFNCSAPLTVTAKTILNRLWRWILALLNHFLTVSAFSCAGLRS